MSSVRKEGENQDVLNFLETKERKMLERLAAYSGRTPVEELKALIRRRALGHLKDLGDDRGSFRLFETDLTGLKIDSVELHE